MDGFICMKGGKENDPEAACHTKNHNRSRPNRKRAMVCTVSLVVL